MVTVKPSTSVLMGTTLRLSFTDTVKMTSIKQPAVSNGQQVLVPWQPFHIGSTVWYLWEGPITCTSKRKHILHFSS